MARFFISTPGVLREVDKWVFEWAVNRIGGPTKVQRVPRDIRVLGTIARYTLLEGDGTVVVEEAN